MKKKGSSIEEPDIYFSEWQCWKRRTTTYDPSHEIPREFDYPGIYLLAYFGNAKLIPKSKKTPCHLNLNIIYIGASTKVTTRLEGKRHDTVNRKYAEMYNDQNFNKLFFTIAPLEWRMPSFEGDDKVKQAYLYYIERKLIWEYAKKWGRLPLLNRL